MSPSATWSDAAIPKPERSLLRSVGIVLATFIAMLSSIVALSGSNIVLPDLGRELHMQQDSLQWVLSAFALSSSCFLLLCGRLADLYGRKLVFLSGSAWMSIFAVGCGFARTANQLLVLRAFQGIGCAATITASLGILAQSFPPGRTRRIAFATFSAGAPFGGGVGLVMGGLLTQLTVIRWRAIFFLLAGLSTLSFGIGYFSMDSDNNLSEEKLDKRVDWMGAMLITTGLVCIMFVLGQGELASQKWKTPYLMATLITGISLVVGFVLWEDHLCRQTTFPPLMRVDIWTRAQGKFAAIQIIQFLEMSSFMSWMLWVQLYYQTYKNYTPLETMIRLIPTSIAGLAITLVVGLLVGWVPAIYLLSLGTIATSIACLLFAVIQVNASYWAFGFPSTVLVVWGADFIFATGALFVSHVAHEDEQSVAGGIYQTCSQLGTAVGLAVTTIVYDRISTQASFENGTTTVPQAQLKGYRAAQWTAFAFAMCAFAISVTCFRGVGIIGGKAKLEDFDEPKIEPDEDSKMTKALRIHGVVTVVVDK